MTTKRRAEFWAEQSIMMGDCHNRCLLASAIDRLEVFVADRLSRHRKVVQW